LQSINALEQSVEFRNVNLPIRPAEELRERPREEDSGVNIMKSMWAKDRSAVTANMYLIQASG
jgi:hypothetical protein